MKTTNRLLFSIVTLLLFTTSSLFAQDEEAPKRPMYVTLTTMHWNMDNDDFDNEEWIATEKEYRDKVVKKNEHIMSSGYMTHRFTTDNRELLYFQTFASWDDIDKARKRNGELSDAAWTDEAAADTFFDKLDNYYAPYHSDEIYATIDGAKLPEKPSDKDMIVYMRISHFAFPKEGSGKEFKELRESFTQNVIHKNEVIKAYYPMVHSYGADRTEFVEVFVLDAMGDLDAMNKRSGELAKENWPDDAKRKEMNKKFGKYFTGVHGDYIYTTVHELQD